MAVRVSVIIATYCSGPELDDVMAALDAQTMPSSDFEVLFVDDGSPDDTYQRLQEFATTRHNVRALQIEHSGWPGRPRNVAMSECSGDYILFVDHDDYVFPEALERMHSFATANSLDVVHGKEVVLGWAGPGWDTWRRQIPRGFDRSTFDCITPHKLYRRQFLVDHGIAFPEGRVRLEDFVLNGEVWSRTDAIGVLADYPCYQWRIHSGNAHKQAYDEDTYWRVFAESVQPILDHVPAGEKQTLLLVRWYRSRILERVGPVGDFASLSQERAQARVTTLLQQMSPFAPSVDAALTPADRTRAALLRRNDVAGLQQLARLDSGIRLVTSTCNVGIDGGTFRIRAEGHVGDASGTPVPFLADSGLTRELPEPLASRLSDAETSYSDGRDSSVVELVIRNRSDSVDWVLPSSGECSVSPYRDGSAQLRWRVDATLEPMTAAAGRPLADGRHEVFARVIGLGMARQNRVGATEVDPVALIQSDKAVMSKQSEAGHLIFVTSGRVREAVRAHLPSPAAVVATPARRDLRLHVLLPGLSVDSGTTTLTLEVAGEERLAALTHERRGVVAEAVLPLPAPGVHRVRARVDTGSPMRLTWIIVDRKRRHHTVRVVGPREARQARQASAARQTPRRLARLGLRARLRRPWTVLRREG